MGQLELSKVLGKSERGRILSDSLQNLRNSDSHGSKRLGRQARRAGSGRARTNFRRSSWASVNYEARQQESI